MSDCDELVGGYSQEMMGLVLEYHWKQRSGLRDYWFCWAFGLSQEKLIAWRKRYGLPNQHNGAMPRDSWLCVKGKQTIISFFSLNRGDGYLRCAYMMIDKDVAYASHSTVYRVLKEAGMLQTKADDTEAGVKVLNSL